ncbi:MAG: hypothetical protein KKC05_00615, partial [Nanoarchaeota archaeon]|nr:hypothetical protein [Nanoarchaeota archaeon]
SYMRAQSFSKPQKAYSLGYDIPYRDFDETERVDPHRFFDLVMEVIPSSLKQSFGSRIMVNLNGSTALDFRLPIRKVDGGRYILKRMGIPMERSVMVEDTDVESIRGNWCVACPANAKPEVKNYVSSRGDEGYISPFSYMQGEIDILNHLAQSSHTLVDL